MKTGDYSERTKHLLYFAAVISFPPLHPIFFIKFFHVAPQFTRNDPSVSLTITESQEAGNISKSKGD
jgi:hypothetical protein